MTERTANAPGYRIRRRGRASWRAASRRYVEGWLAGGGLDRAAVAAALARIDRGETVQAGPAVLRRAR